MRCAIGPLKSCSAPANDVAEVTVFAAASLTDALKELASGWEKSGGEKVVFNFAASSTLARQIREGAPADLFLSADEIQMDTLEKAGLIAPGTRKSILSNTLVVVVPSDSPLRISNARDLAGPGVRKARARGARRASRPVSTRRNSWKASESGRTSRRGSSRPRTSARPWPPWSRGTWTPASSTRRTR